MNKIKVEVQLNGRQLGHMFVDPAANAWQIKHELQASKVIAHELNGRIIVKEIYVPGKLYNIVTSG